MDAFIGVGTDYVSQLQFIVIVNVFLYSFVFISLLPIAIQCVLNVNKGSNILAFILVRFKIADNHVNYIDYS